MSYRVIGASAGTGKTHRLTSCVLDALDAGLAPEALCGVTFTKKAAGELTERLRTRLFAAGKPALAQRLGMAYLGTTNAVGLRLVAEYAIEAGLSPEVGVLPEDGGGFLHALIEQVVSDAQQRSLDVLARRLRINWDSTTRTTNWQADVFKIVDAARMNRIGPEALPAMATRSWQTLSAFLDPPTSADLDAALRAALDAAESAVTNSQVKKDQAFLARLAERRGDLADGIWEPWAALDRVDLSKGFGAQRDAIQTVALKVLSHPRLHADLARYSAETFAAAAAMLAAFADWKKAARVVDHTDQLDLAWHVIGRPEVAAELRASLGLVVVDELQDSNPLQLALFTRLHGLAGRSVWVGDPKQCIFEWNGADPSLVDVVLASMKASVSPSAALSGASGDEIERLAVNRRSRPELVSAVSELFASAFGAHGMHPDEVRVSAFRTDPEGVATLPPLGIGLYDPDQERFANAAAARVAALLAAPDDTLVVDRWSGECRPLSAGDIAVLLTSNDQCRELAAALGRYGVRAATARNGLLQTPEGCLLRAALALVVAADDPVAEAEIEALLGRDGDHEAVIAQRDAWLTARIQAVASQAGSRPGPWSRLLDAVRNELAALSPGAVVERIFAVLDLARRLQTLPDGAIRTANLDALRRLTANYEALATARSQPLTVSGLLRAFAAIIADDKDMPLDDEQHVTASPDAVQVMTYHKAKGLEWPVVFLGGLDKSPKRDVFSVACESDAATFSLADPLSARWVRHWPWPFSPTRTGALEQRVAASPIGQQVQLRERRERVRLLYVGFTRARDHLVLLIAEKAKGERATAWLDELVMAGKPAVSPAAAVAGKPAWELTRDAVPRFFVTGPDGVKSEVRARRSQAIAAPTAISAPELGAWQRPEGAPPPLPRRDISPSRMTADDLARLGVRAWTPRGPMTQLGCALAIPTPKGFTEWDHLGTAIHGFLASDEVGAGDDERLRRATTWSMAHRTVAQLTPQTLIDAADRFARWVEQRWPGAQVVREVPIAADIEEGRNRRRISGVIDALIVTGAGWVVVDHKSFPAPGGAWKKAGELAPQLALYAHALAALPAGRTVIGICLHFPIAGVVVELK